MKPTVGRIVHFRSTNRDSEPVAAIIVSVHGDTVDLNVMRPGNTQFEFVRNATQAESFEKSQGGEWSWPEQV